MCPCTNWKLQLNFWITSKGLLMCDVAQSLVLSAAHMFNPSAPLFIMPAKELLWSLDETLDQCFPENNPNDPLWSPRAHLANGNDMLVEQSALAGASTYLTSSRIHVVNPRDPPVRQNAPLFGKKAPLVPKFSLLFKWGPNEIPHMVSHMLPKLCSQLAWVQLWSDQMPHSLIKELLWSLYDIFDPRFASG